MDQVIFKDCVGSANRHQGAVLSEVRMSNSLRVALENYYGDGLRLSPPQEWAIANGLFDEGNDFLICAPTNSGKTLIAILKIFTTAIVLGKRSVYVAPLKALAEEKAEEFRSIAEGISNSGGPIVRIAVTTGDYHQTEDFLGSPPPEDGEIIICTPERLEVMLRNPENHEWASKVGAYIIDEFHLLGDAKRGIVVESLLTRLLSLETSASIMALSATIGGIDSIRFWLIGNDRNLKVLESNYRYPQLERNVLLVEDKNKFICNEAKKTLVDPASVLLVFVFTQKDAEKLAAELTDKLDAPDEIGFFHAGLSREKRNVIASEVKTGVVRVLVTTTSLKMGVNLPATDVIVRDLFLSGRDGRRKLSISDILQMIGRAGRGENVGVGQILCEDLDLCQHYKEGLDKGILEIITPQLVKPSNGCFRTKQVLSATNPLSGMVLSEISGRKKAEVKIVKKYLNHSFSASQGLVQIQDINEQFSLLETGKLIFKVEESEATFGVTKLGRTVSLCGMSPESGVILAGFLRALINLAEKKKEREGTDPRYLNRLSDLDFIFLALASYEGREHWLPEPSKVAINKVQEYIENLPPEDKPIVNLWRSEESSTHPTRRLLSTLRIDIGETRATTPEKIFYRVMQTAVLLHRHANGRRLSELSQDYKVNEGRLENGLKYIVLWILNGLSQVCDSRKCYKLEPLRIQILELIDNLNMGATLGKLLQIKGVGKKSLFKLIECGFIDLPSLKALPLETYLKCGVKELTARKIAQYVMRKNR